MLLFITIALFFGQAVSLIGPSIQIACQFEARLTSVERLDEYIKVRNPREPYIDKFSKRISNFLSLNIQSKLIWREVYCFYYIVFFSTIFTARKTLKSEGLQRKVTASVAADWPRSGDVTFNDVCMAYDTNNKQVLKKVSFSVISGQSIGIIGRTGAGK